MSTTHKTPARGAGADQRRRTDPQRPPAESARAWVRFERYEVRAGLIRPAAGARLVPYDPWAAYRVARSGWGGRGGPAPYEALLALAGRLRWAATPPGEPPRLVPIDEAALAGWCARHGLLGLLSEEAVAVSLPPDADTPGARFHPLAPPGAGSDTGPLAAAAAVLLRPLPDHRPTVCRVEDVWKPFFSERDTVGLERAAYPLPGSEPFWPAYAEPVERFVAAAALLHEAARRLGGAPSESANGVALLEALLAGVCPVLQRGLGPESACVGAWRVQSLLGAYALMLWHDLAAGWRVLTCDRCCRLFVSHAYQARYCSPRCCNTMVKRAYRARQAGRRAGRSRPQGM